LPAEQISFRYVKAGGPGALFRRVPRLLSPQSVRILLAYQTIYPKKKGVRLLAPKLGIVLFDQLFHLH
jgi:hypothetical protein